MRNFGILLRTRLKETKNIGLAITGLLYAAGLILFYGIATLLADHGLAAILPLTAYLGAAVVCFIAVVLSINETFSGEDDSEFLLSTPIPSITQVMTMFVRMYVRNVLMTALIEVPFYAVFRQYAAISGPAAFGVGAFAAGLLLTSMPICGIATLIGMFVLLCLSSSPLKDRIMSATALLFVTIAVALVLVIADRIYIVTTSETVASDVICAQLITEITSNIRLARFYQLGIVEGQGTYIFLFGFMSFIWYAVFLFMHAMSYQVVITALNSPVSYGERTAEEVLGKMHAHSRKRAQMKKEFQRFFGSKSYLTHSATGMILGLAVTSNFLIMRWICGGSIGEMAGGAAGQGVGLGLHFPAAAVPPMICLFVGLCNTTYCAYSLEGRQSWILDAAPLDTKDADLSKVAVNLSISLPTAVLGALCSIAAFQPVRLLSILYVLIPVIYAFLGAFYGIFIGRRFADPRPAFEKQIMRSGPAYLLGYLPQVLLPAAVMIMIAF